MALHQCMFNFGVWFISVDLWGILPERDINGLYHKVTMHISIVFVPDCTSELRSLFAQPLSNVCIVHASAFLGGIFLFTFVLYYICLYASRSPHFDL